MKKTPSFSADISSSKLNGKSKLPASGKYILDSEKWRAVIRDPISNVVFHILIENDIINAYSTYDKILFLSDAKSPELFSATYNPSSIFAIVSGKIPLIAELAKFKENSATLEYDDADFSQKINFSDKKKVSDLTIENKKNPMNFIIRYDTLSETDNYSYYKRIHAEETVSGDYFDFTYKNITIEKSISDSIFDLKIPKGTRVINTTGKL